MCRKISVSALLLLLTASVAAASSDPPVEPRVLNQVQNAARLFIDERMVDGAYLHYDATTDRVERLEFKMLHPQVSKEGDLYVARADFFDDEGRPINMRFLVVMRDNRPHTLQAIAHALGFQAVPPCADSS
jgi:hypothetical protein